ncbi:hypothetical protein ACPF8X_32030 [Streptomyces sp. G35A]
MHVPEPAGRRERPPGSLSNSRELTTRQAAIVAFIEDTVARQRYPPPMREIGQAVRLASTSSVSHQLMTLENKRAVAVGRSDWPFHRVGSIRCAAAGTTTSEILSAVHHPSPLWAFLLVTEGTAGRCLLAHVVLSLSLRSQWTLSPIFPGS